MLGAECPRAQVGAAGGGSRLVLVFRKRAGRGAGSGLLNYLGCRGAIYLRGLTCFCGLGELAVWKTDSAEVYLFILQVKQTNTTRLRRGTGNWRVCSQRKS